MTAFGRWRETVGGKDITVELRSVNNRFFDCSVKLPRTFMYLEDRVKPYLQSKGISRGKIDVNISIDIVDSEDVSVTLDEGYAKGYIAALRLLRDEFGLADDISVMTVAQNRDLFKISKPEDDAERDWQDISVVLEKATDSFIAARRAEGARLEADIRLKLETIRACAAEISGLSEADVGGYKSKLEERLRTLLSDGGIKIDEGRLLTECAIFADRISIDEELVRLNSHLEAFSSIAGANEPAGRKLDFLIQEMNREINTAGSKCQNARIARLVVDCKCELEKIREQIQNIE
jgi:uncharacterized protein (TIGR00255 family)